MKERSMRNRYLRLIVQRCFSLASLTLGIFFHSEGFAGQLMSVQSSDSYEAAINNLSTSPSYVEIFIAEGEAGQPKPICTTANFLLGAIHREYGLGYDTSDLSKAAEIAIKSSDRVFRFRQRSALDNIPMKYSANDLSEARALLAPFSADALKEKFSSLYSQYRLPTNGYARDAIACALVERGLSPKLADISGQVYVDR